MAYGQYRGRNIGRLMRFLYRIDANSDYWAKFGDDKVYHGLGTEVVATYDWIGESDVPIFQFTEKYQHYNDRQAIVREQILKLEELSGREPWNETAEREREQRERAERLSQMLAQVMN